MNICNIVGNYKKVKDKYQNINILIVTKYFDANNTEKIFELLQGNFKEINFAENKIQDSVLKIGTLKKVKSFLIGHLQTNKIKKAVEIFDVIESVDSLHLAEEINKYSKQIGKVQEVYIQINISGEEQKFGIDPDKIYEILNEIKKFSNLKITGLMTIASVNNELLIRNQFSKMKNIFDGVKKQFPEIINLSMGMSGDFEVAIEYSATEIRLGQILFE